MKNLRHLVTLLAAICLLVIPYQVQAGKEFADELNQAIDDVLGGIQPPSSKPTPAPTLPANVPPTRARPTAQPDAPTSVIEMMRIPGRDYVMGKYEVTQKQWHDVMGNNPSKFSGCDNCPVEQVSWDDIQIYLQKLNARTGRQYRLPTEAEWEYACYGGKQTEYCGSDDIESVAWYDGNSNETTHPVGQKQANGYGLYDMSGNVFEWVQDMYDSSKLEYGRALRGGSWVDEPQYVGVTYRYAFGSSLRDYSYGFRLARTL